MIPDIVPYSKIADIGELVHDLGKHFALSIKLTQSWIKLSIETKGFNKIHVGIL